MESKNPLELPVIQTVHVVNGSPSAPPDPWVAALPSALGTPLLLRPPEGLPVNMDRVRHRLDRTLRECDIAARLEGYALVDVLVLPDGSEAALVEWNFDYYRMTGHGGSGEEWKESRALLPVTSDEAETVVRLWRSAMEPSIAEAETEAAAEALTRRMRATLSENRLDAPSVRERRDAALKAAGLDPEAVEIERRRVLQTAGYEDGDISAFKHRLQH